MKYFPGVAPVALLLFFAFLFFSSTCGREEEEKAVNPAALPSIGVLAFNKSDIYTGLVLDALANRLSGRANVEFHDAEQDQLRQNDQLERLLARKPDAIAVSLVDTQAVGLFLERIAASGVPVIFFNRAADIPTLRTYSKARFVGMEERGAGRIQGRAIAELWRNHPEYDRNRDGILQFVMFQAAPHIGESLARTEESVKEGRRLGAPLEQLGPTYMCNWEYETALRSMRSAFNGYGQAMELVIANNDAMALGAVAALNEYGYNLAGGAHSRFIPVVGVDAVPQAVEAIGKGMMSATVRQDIASMAEAMAVMLLNAASRRDFLDNARFSYDESGIAVRLPYLPFYKENAVQ